MERKNLDQLLGQAESSREQKENYKKEFYKDAIELHEDERLKKIAGKGFPIIKGKRKKDKELWYTSKGFETNIPEYFTDFHDDGGYYSASYHTFQVEQEKLVIKSDRNSRAMFDYSRAKEMLELFPKVTTNEVIEALEEGVKDLIQD